MKTTSCLLAVALLPALLVSAPAAEPGGLDIKNKSQFTAADGMHNPFWPIGWVKQGRISAPMVTKAGISAEGFTVTSVLLGNPALAVVNGREYQEGEMIRVNGVRTEIQVAAIRDGEVVLRSGDSQVVLQMKRK